MIGMFDTMASRSSFALADVEKIGPAERGEGSLSLCKVTFRDGRHIKIADFEAKALMERPVQIMPAEPGTRIVCFDSAGDAWFKPMIGWAISFDGSLHPLTPSGVDQSWMGGEDTQGESYIMMPSGVVVSNTDRGEVYDTLDELLAERREERQLRAARNTGSDVEGGSA